MNPVDPIAAPPATPGPGADRKRLREAAEAFESILLHQLLRQMRRAQLEEGFFGKGAGSSTYESMFEESLARTMAAGSPLGLADMLEAQWAGDDPGSIQVPPDPADEKVWAGTGTVPLKEETHENP